VPLAAALWSGGISFGGVIAFIFADLITFPLLLIYRRYYGTRLMLRMLAVFWAVMSTAGLLTELLFAPPAWCRPPDHQVAPAHFSWNYTTYLNLSSCCSSASSTGSTAIASALGAGDRYAIDPVCGMQVEKAHAPATRDHGGERQYFCSARIVSLPMRMTRAVPRRGARTVQQRASDHDRSTALRRQGRGVTASPPRL
jgi:hypothetical protein